MSAIVSQSIDAPDNVTRLADWRQRVANRKRPCVETVVEAVRAFCARRGLSKVIEEDAANLALMRINQGASGATAIEDAKARAKLVAQYGRKKS